MGRKGNSRNGGLARAKALTPERSSEIGRKAGKASAESKTFEQKSKQGHEAGLRSRINLTKEQSSEIGRKAGLVGGRKAASLQKSGAHIRVHCPHCGLESNLMVLKRWHFDKCKLNPNHSMNNSPPMT
jgi:general stress protein YciG